MTQESATGRAEPEGRFERRAPLASRIARVWLWRSAVSRFTPGEASRHLPSSNRLRNSLYLFLLTCPAAVAAYYLMFCRPINFNDDEGTMMMSVKAYLTGSKLYDQIFSYYGPTYYFYNWFIHSISGTAVTHDATRMTTAVMWTICALAGSWIVLRLTSSLALAALTHILLFMNLAFFGNEPGTVQELSMLLLLGLAMSGLMLEELPRPKIAMVIVGTATAALLMIKINAGVFVVLSAALAILYSLPVSTISRIGKFGAAGAALLVPYLVMKIHLDDSPTRVYCFVVTASIAALLAGLGAAPKSAVLRLEDCWSAVAAFAATIVTAWFDLTVHGVSSYGIFNSLVLRTLSLIFTHRYWYLSLRLDRLWIPWALGGLAAAWWLGRLARREPKRAYGLVAAVKLIFGAGVLLLAAIRPEMPGYSPIKLSLMIGFATPYCWLLLYPPSEHAGPAQAFPRYLLSITTVFQTLWAFPFAGTQAAFTRIFPILVGAIAIGDSISATATSRGATTAESQWSLPFGLFHSARSRRVFAVVLLAYVPLTYLALAYRTCRIYQSLPSLALPGAERVHVPEPQIRIFHWLTRNVGENCDVFMGIPDLQSLNFWTKKDPPTSLAVDHWSTTIAETIGTAPGGMITLNDAQQLEIKSALSAHPNACIVFNPYLLSVWNTGHRDLYALPLSRYIFDNFKIVGGIEGYYLMMRKERTTPAL